MKALLESIFYCSTHPRVKFAVNTETNESVAIKILEKEKIQKQKMGEQIKREISILKLIRHKYIVNLIEVLASPSKIFIVLELVTGGELFDKIVALGKLDEATARYYFLQLVEGVMYCHSQGVCHRDLKPENLLLDDKLNLKISDFGLSSLTGVNNCEGKTSLNTSSSSIDISSGDSPINESDNINLSSSTSSSSSTILLHTTCGTPNYVAPEVLLDKGYDGKLADIWSMGVILFVLLSGYLPFDEPNMTDLFKKISTATYSFPSFMSEDARNLIQRILNPDPSKRYSLIDILNDPWMRNESVKSFPLDFDDSAEGTKMNKTPSEIQIKNAISDINLDDHKTHKKHNSIVKLSAFEVVSLFGNVALNRMLLKENTQFPKNVYLTTTNKPNVIVDILNKTVNEMQNCSIVEVNSLSFKVYYILFYYVFSIILMWKVQDL